MNSPGFVDSRVEGTASSAFRIAWTFSNLFFFPRSCLQPPVPGDVGTFMMGHGQTSVMYLKPWFLPSRKDGSVVRQPSTKTLKSSWISFNKS